MALLNEKDASVGKLKELSVKVIRDDEENRILLDEVMQLCKDNDIDEELSESQSAPIPVKRSDRNHFQRELPKQVECTATVLPLAHSTLPPPRDGKIVIDSKKSSHGRSPL